MVRAWAHMARASASKMSWLATVPDWFSMSRAPARVSTSSLKVTWACPPADSSQASDGLFDGHLAGRAGGRSSSTCTGFDVAAITVHTPLRDGLPDLAYIKAASRTLSRTCARDRQ
jgi:hypothetical protein